jgi:hypothetical protein
MAHPKSSSHRKLNRARVVLVALLSVALGGCGEDPNGGGSGVGGASAGAGGAGAGGAGTGGAGAGAGAGAGGANTGGGGTGGTGGVGGCGVAFSTFADGKTPAQTLWVQGGAAVGGDGSQAQPFASLAEAALVATPGTELRVVGEVESHSQITLKGTADAPIFISGAPGAKLRGVSSAALKLAASSYVVVQDLELYESPNHVLHFDFSDHLMLRRLHVHRATTACLKGSQSSNIYVEDSDFHGAAELPGGNPVSAQVLDWVGVNGGHILRNKLHDGPTILVMLKGGTSDLLVAYNEIYDQLGGNSSAALHLGQWTDSAYFQPANADYEAARVVAFANLIRDVEGPPFAFQGCEDCAAVHNTMWNTTGGQLIRYLPGNVGSASSATVSLTRGSRFSGNIVVGGQASGASLNADGASIGAGNQIDHNVILKPGALNWWGEIAQDSVTSTYDQDPLLSASGVPGNVALVAGKGASDLAGLPFAASFGRDFGGACWSSPLDIGAIKVP